MNRSIATTSFALAAAFIATSASAETVFAIASMDGMQALVKFDSAAPGSASVVNPITGLEEGESLLGLDQRPADTKLFAVSTSSRLYRVDRHSGEAVAVNPASFATALNGTSFGFDFNPQIDRIRNVSDADQNLVLNPITGALQLVATPVFYVAGDPNFAADPNVVHHAYNNNFFGTTATQLFAIDSDNDMFVKQANNAGTITSVGPLGVDFSSIGGLDISGDSGIAYAVSTNQCESLSAACFYTIDTGTGAASFGGVITTADGEMLNIVAMTVYTPPACRSDFDNSGTVDGIDLGLLLAGWLSGDDRLDTSDDGIADGADWGFVMADWGTCISGQ